MREIRPSGSEGGGPQLNAASLPPIRSSIGGVGAGREAQTTRNRGLWSCHPAAASHVVSPPLEDVFGLDGVGGEEAIEEGGFVGLERDAVGADFGRVFDPLGEAALDLGRRVAGLGKDVDGQDVTGMGLGGRLALE